MISGGILFIQFPSFDFLMSSLVDKKPVLAPEVVQMMSKIMGGKLNSPNHLDWSKTIRIFLKSIQMASHLTKDPPTDDLKEQ